MNRIVITGPTGAIGIALIQKCIQENIMVLAICHKGSVRNNRIPRSKLVTIVEANLDELKCLEFKEEPYDIFYHLAWNGTFGDTRNNMYLQLKNIEYTLDAANLAKRLGCHTFIGAGSQAEYGRSYDVLTPKTMTSPENGYGMAKLCAGQMSKLVSDALSIRHIWTRILSVYGPYDGENTMIMSTIHKLLKKEQASFTKGEQLWDYLYSKDAAEALYQLGLTGVHGKVYCLGSGEAKPLKEYIDKIGRVMKEESLLGIGDLSYRTNEVMHLQADISELKKDTEFKVKHSFDEGIQETINWYKSMVID